MQCNEISHLFSILYKPTTNYYWFTSDNLHNYITHFNSLIKDVDQQVFLPSSNCMHGRVQYSSNGSFATSTGPIRLFVIAGNYPGLHPRDIQIDNKWTDREYWTLLLPCLFGYQYRMCLPCVCLRSLLPSDSKGSLFPTLLVPNSFRVFVSRGLFLSFCMF